MLLLLLNEMNECHQEIPEAEQAYLLDDLFDVKLGMIEDRYHPHTSEGSERVGFLSISSFINVPGKDARDWENALDQFNQIDESKLKKALHKQQEKKTAQKLKTRSVPLSYISENRLLQRADYLISMRGMPTGFSLYNTKLVNSGQYRLVASNHFVQLRPRTPEDIYVPYLHLMLDLLIQHHLQPRFDEKLKNLKSIGSTAYGVINPFSIRDLRGLKLHVFKDINKQKEIYEKFKIRYETFLEQSRAFHAYQQCMFFKLKISA